MPLYLVNHPGPDGPRERLVEANNIAAARNFAAKDLVQVKKAESADCFRVAKAGGEIEVATSEPGGEPGAPESGGEPTE